MTKTIALAGAATMIALLGAPGASHASVTLYNARGASAPCIGFGPIGGPVAERCAQMFEQEGFVRANALGVSGLSIGTAGQSDGVVTQVDPGSPAARAGLAPGDVVVSVDGHDLKPTPGAIAAEQIFGRRGAKINITVRRAGAERAVDLTLAPAPEPAGPKWDNMLVANRLLVDARGEFVPCIGAGPLALAALAFCSSHFKPYGFIEADALGGSGLTLDMDRTDRATIKAVEADSPAARAGLAPGDEIAAVNGQALTSSTGQIAKERLFGRAGDTRRVTVRRGGAEKSFQLILVPAHG